MAVEINQIPITTTSITSGSFFPLDLATGGSPAYETRKVTLNHLANNILDETLTANRSLDINGNILQFDNGQVVIGNAIGANTKLEVVGSGATRAITALATGTVAVYGADSTGQGVQGYTVSGYGVVGVSVGSGIAVYGTSVSGVAGYLSGGLLVETYGFGSSPAPSAVATFNANDKGVLFPRLTTAQRDAIPTPALGLLIFNTTTNRFEHFNGTYWQGCPTLYGVKALTSSPVDAQTVYFGNLPKAPTTTANISKVHIKHNGVIRKANIYCYAGTAGTSEKWSLYIRINGTTDYLIETIGAATNERIFNNESLNIPVVEGDYFEIKAVNPTWVTNPLTTVYGGNIVLE